MILANVDRYRVVEPLFEGVRVILSHRGEPYSPAYIQGISGAAFRIGGICPCAPTCCTAMWTEDLIHLLGYTTESFVLSREGSDPATLIGGMVDRVKEEIRANRPALVWHAFTNAEWDVVCGFDDNRAVFYGRGSYVGYDNYAYAAQTRAKDAVEFSPAFGALFVGEKKQAFDTRSAEVNALTEAVRHAHSDLNKNGIAGDQWVMLEGLLCYDRWIADFRNPAKTRGPGDAYCHSIYRSTHRAAAQFLKEIAARYPAAQPFLQAAANDFAAEAEVLDGGENLLGWNSPAGPDPVRNRLAADLLSRARTAYARGIAHIEAALPLL